MIYLQLYFAFFKIGLLGFGGGMAVVKLISDSIQQFVAITPSEFANIVGIAQITPGPIAVNTATYIGYESSGVLGSFVATLGVATPAFILVALVCRFVTNHQDNRTMNAALYGIRPATAGMVAAALITIGLPAVINEERLGANFASLYSSLPESFDLIAVLICVATIVLIKKFKANTFAVLIAMGIIGAILGA